MATGRWHPLQDGDGRASGRVEDDDALRSSREHLQFVADATASSIAHCSADRRFLFVNKAYAERFGLTPGEIVGRSVAEVLGEGAYESIPRSTRRARWSAGSPP